jgi:hypothetical protein
MEEATVIACVCVYLKLNIILVLKNTLMCRHNYSTLDMALGKRVKLWCCM